MKYQNNGKYKKILYGVEFNPGDIKEVPGFINLRTFKVVKDAAPKASKAEQNRKRPGRPAKKLVVESSENKEDIQVEELNESEENNG